jgi:hypothetical protein
MTARWIAAAVGELFREPLSVNERLPSWPFARYSALPKRCLANSYP